MPASPPAVHGVEPAHHHYQDDRIALGEIHDDLCGQERILQEILDGYRQAGATPDTVIAEALQTVLAQLHAVNAALAMIAKHALPW